MLGFGKSANGSGSRRVLLEAPTVFSATAAPSSSASARRKESRRPPAARLRLARASEAERRAAGSGMASFGMTADRRLEQRLQLGPDPVPGQGEVRLPESAVTDALEANVRGVGVLPDHDS